VGFGWGIVIEITCYIATFVYRIAAVYAMSDIAYAAAVYAITSLRLLLLLLFWPHFVSVIGVRLTSYLLGMHLSINFVNV